MTIREWFGMNGQQNLNETIHVALDELLHVYHEALIRYFHIREASDLKNLITTVKDFDLTPGDTLFIQWLESKGLPYFTELFTSTLPNDDSLIAQLQYEKYMLEMEMEYGVTDDLRSCLIDIIDELPNRIIQILAHQTQFRYEIIYQNMKENVYSTPKIEGVQNMGSFNFFRG